jgi:O-antigen/teichoic acid export membrane protein
MSTLVERLPKLVRARLEGRYALQRAINNSFWLFLDQSFRMVAGLLVGVWTARYLGPERYGWLSYALAIVGVVTSATSLGINNVVVRELVLRPQESAPLMGTAFRLRCLGASVGVLACLLIAWWRGRPDDPVKGLIIVLSLGMVMQLGDVIDLLLQARQESWVSAWIRMGANLLASFLRIGLLLADAPIIWFAAAAVAEFGLSSLGWLWVARRRGWQYQAWHGEWVRMLTLLKESWPLALAGLTIYAQAYADQVIIGSALGGSQLGQYAAAIRIISVFSFIPTVIQTVAAVEITRAKQEGEVRYQQRLFNLYRLMIGIFLVVAVPLILFGSQIAQALYGHAYAGASVLLPWLTLRLLFTNFGVARSIFITNENLFRFALATAVAGALVNIALNLVLVPAWGAPGAIAASMVSFIITTFGLEPFQPRARQNLYLMLQAIFFPWRRQPQGS